MSLWRLSVELAASRHPDLRTFSISPVALSAMESGPALSQTDELARRPVRSADYAAENRALVALARVQAGPRAEFLQAIADTALALCRAGSAGISLVEGPD